MSSPIQTTIMSSRTTSRTPTLRFRQLNLDVINAKMFFKTLGAQTGRDRVLVQAFFEGCVRMTGTASNIDLHIMSVEMHTVHKDLHEFVMSFSDFVANTLFASLYAQHIGEAAERLSGQRISEQWLQLEASPEWRRLAHRFPEAMRQLEAHGRGSGGAAAEVDEMGVAPAEA